MQLEVSIFLFALQLPKPSLESGVVFPCSWAIGSRVKFTFTEPCDWPNNVRPIQECRGIARQLESSNRGVDEEILTQVRSYNPVQCLYPMLIT